MDIRPVRDFTQRDPLPQPGPAAAVQAASTAVPADTVNPVRRPDAVPALDELTQALKQINKAMETSAQGIEFTLDEDLQRTVVKVVDRNTNEVLRQMPSAEALEIAKTLDKLQGLLISQDA